MATTAALPTTGMTGQQVAATEQQHQQQASLTEQQQQQRSGEAEEHPRTGVTVTLPTIQVTEPRVPTSEGVTPELLALDLRDTSRPPTSSLTVRTSSSTSSTSGISTLPLLEKVSRPRPSSSEVKLPPLVVPPLVPPATLAEAVELVRKSNMMLYLTLKHSPSELEYNPYSFNVECKRPRGASQYAILSSAGVTQVWPTEVTFTSMEDFQREFAVYRELKKIRFFRNFRVNKTWQVWRRSVRCRKVREAKTRVAAYLLTHQPPFHATLTNIAALCHRLSHMGLLQVSSDEPVLMEAWVARQQAALTNVRTRMASFRSLLLQVVACMVQSDEPPADPDGSELLSGEKKPTSPRSNTGSSLTRRHAHTSVVKMVRVVDLMVASALRTILHNTVSSLLNAFTTKTSTISGSQQEEDTEEFGAMFLVKVSVESSVVMCTPTQEGLMSGLRAVLRACEMTVLSTQPLLPYFTPYDRLSSVSSEENPVLRTMLEDDPYLRGTTERVLALLEDSWSNVEAEVNPLGGLLEQAEMQTHEEGIQGQELSELGSWLARVEGLVEAARGVKEVVGLGLLQVNQTAAKKVLVTSLRQQQQRIHQDVSQGFDQRVRALLADANDKWLGLELAPVTAQQVVTLLNYVTEVKDQMERVNQEEKVIQEAYEMIQGYHIMLHPEVHNKYEALQKEVKRLRKSVRRSLMERPSSIRKLKHLLDKEIEEVDAETAKLAEQVQALRFLRVTSDREEALKMLEAAVSRASTIRSQATTVTHYQTTFQLPVCPFKELVEVEEEISLKMLLWRSLSEWEELTEKWYQQLDHDDRLTSKDKFLCQCGRPARIMMLDSRIMVILCCGESEVRSLDVQEVQRVTLEYRGRVDHLMGATQHSDVLLHLESLVTHLQEKLSVLEALTDSALRPRHWQEIEAALSQSLPPSFTLIHVDEMALHKHAHTLQQVAHTAQLQQEMENRLKQVEESWKAATFPVVDYIRKDVYILGDLTHLDSLLLDTDLTLHLLLHSQHALHIKSDTVKWKNIHTIIKQTVVALREFEEEWLALDPVLTTCTAHEVFPLQAAVFAATSTFWAATLARMREESHVLHHLRGGMLQEEVLQERTQLQGLQVCLAPLLAMRRQTCPRLFLLPNTDLLELLTKGQEPKVCEKYLRRLFTGVGRLVRRKDGRIEALVSPQEEVLSLAKPVLAHHGVEDWLGRVESGMRATLKRLVLRHMEKELDLGQSQLPLQVLDVCRRIQWSRQITMALNATASIEMKTDLHMVMKGVKRELKALTGTMRQSHDNTNTPLRAAQLAYFTATLLELRDITAALIKDNPTSRWSYSWLQHLHHEVMGEGRGASVQVNVGVGTLDYGYEYMGVATASTPTPTTLRTQHNLLTAAIRHKCGVAVGGVGAGKTETVKGLARAAGQYLATLTCTTATPAQSLQSVVSGGVQSGFWLLLEEADHLLPTLLARIAQYAHNVYHTKLNALKRCVIDGQEMKLVDSFSLFMTVTSHDDPIVTSSYPLINHPITPHITSVIVYPPKIDTLLEAVLLGQGFSVSLDYLQKARQCFNQLSHFLSAGPQLALARLVQATARVSCDIRNFLTENGGLSEDSGNKHENSLNKNVMANKLYVETQRPNVISEGTLRLHHGGNQKKTNTTSARPASATTSIWMRHPIYSRLLTDEEIITQAMYAVLTPLLSNREEEWRRVFMNIFEIEEIQEHQRSLDISEIEGSIWDALIERGYGHNEFSETGKDFHKMKSSNPDVNTTDFDMTKESETNRNASPREENTEFEGNDQSRLQGTATEKSCTQRGLSSHGMSLLMAALHMYSLLTIHHCCCITAPSGAGKSTVWRILAESLNKLWRNKIAQYPNTSSWKVSWRVLQCGAFTRSHLLGSWQDEGRVWRKGVLFTTLTEAQQCAGERWVVLVGPFPPGVLAALVPLCQPSPIFQDEALYQVILGHHIKVILEVDHEEDLIFQIRVRCPVLEVSAEEVDAVVTARAAVQQLADVLPLLQPWQVFSRTCSSLADGLLNLKLPHTSLMCTARCVCSLVEARVTPAAPPGEILEAMTQVLELLHTALHPHLHQDAREGSYTPARLDSRSPAPSDAFLDYAGRVVATPEFQAGLNLLPQLLDASCPLLLYSKPGNGLSTFLDIFERNLAPATRVIRYKCTPLSTAEDLFSCMTGSLLPSPIPSAESLSSSRTSCNDSHSDWSLGKPSPTEPLDVIQLLAPGDEGFSLLVLEDINLQLETDGVVGTIWETCRHMMECGEVVCPVTGRRYLLQRVVPILAVSCSSFPFHHIPPRFLRHCVVMGLPNISPSTCEYIIKVCLQDVLVEIDEDNYLPEATRDVIFSFYQNICGSPTPSPSTSAPAPQKPFTASKYKDCDATSERSINGFRDPGAVCHHGSVNVDNHLSSVKDCADFDQTSDDVSNVDTSIPADNAEAHSTISIDNNSIKMVHKDTRSYEVGSDDLAPNLHHLVQLTEALRRNSCYLQLTMGQASSLIAFQARRIFSGIVTCEVLLKKRICAIIKTYFDEAEERVAWWPGVTEDGKKMMVRARDYNEFLKNIQYPEGLHPIMFTHAHFDSLLKLVLTMETFCGHAIIIGPPGVGKMSLAKLAAHNIRGRLYELDDYWEEAGRVEAIRAAVEASGVGGRRTVILLRDHALTPTILDIIYCLAQVGWSEGLWEPLKVRGLLEMIRQKGKSPRPQENRWMAYLEEEELAALKLRFTTSVKRNLHVCLITHSHQVSEEWCARYPSLRSRWTWVRMDTWKPETLREVARRILLPADLPPHILHQLQAALPAIHQVLAQEAALTVTVTDFVESCQVTVNLLARRRAQLRDSVALFKGGMEKLQETSGNVEELKGELGELEPELKATQEEGQRLTHALSQQRAQVAHIRDQMLAQEEKVKEKSEAVTALNEEVVQEVGEAVPGLEAAEKAIRALDKKDLVEVRVLNKPPDLVLAVMEPICLLLNVKQDWSAMKTLLGDPTMTKRLIEIEKDTITDATLRKLKKYTENPKFMPEEVGKVSKPCRPLCSWLKALEHYAQVLRNVEPKKLRLTELERELSGIQLEQRQLQQQLGQNERELSELQARYEGCVCRRQQLEGGIKRASARLQRCTRLTTVLADEDSRWSTRIKVLMSEVESVYGECALGGVAVAYLASLLPSERDRLLHQVISILTNSGIITPKKYDLVNTLSTGEARESWEAADLYCDPACFLQAAFVMAAARRTLVLDPDYMCVRWLTRMYENKGGLVVLQAGDDTLLTKVLTAAHARRPILILHTPTYLTHSLRKVLEVPRIIQGGEGVRMEVIMVLVTGTAAPCLPPELCVHLTRVSFALPPLVLEERLLNDVLKMEREDLYEQRANLTASIKRDQKALAAVDDNILRKLTQASTALLDNEELLAAFYEAKSTSAEFRTRLAECRRTLQKIGNVRDKYRPVATRGRLLFSTSTALRRLNTDYVFSFQHFLHLFSVCITCKDRTEALSFDQRIDSLVCSVTQLVVTHVSRALQPAHRLSFTTALCAAVSAHEGTLKPPVWRAILDPSHLDEHALLKAVVALEAEFDSIANDLLRGARLQLILHDLVTDVGLTGSRGVPEAPRGRISDFNALMLLRLSKPRLLVAGAREVVNIMLGDPTLLRPDLALSKMLGAEDRKLPVLVRTDYGRDVAAEVLAAAHARGVASITKVIMAEALHSDGASGGGEMVGVPPLATLLVNAVQQGSWVVVQGAECPNVQPTLLAGITSLGSHDVKVHEDFRLVMTVGVGADAPSDLTLLARPLYAQPAPTLPATLAAVAALINGHYYRHHYLGSSWRRAVWQVAAAHTITSVTRHWHGHPAPTPTPRPSTLTPRTQISRALSFASPTSSHSIGEPEEGRGYVGLCGHINLEEVTAAFTYLTKLSLEQPLSDETLVQFLGMVYGRREAWQDMVCTLPREVGLVSKEAALSIVAAHLTTCLPDLHNLTLDVEYCAFQEDLTAIAKDLFSQPPPAVDE